MQIHAFKAEGLAQLSYLIADPDSGTAVVIDPRRDTECYRSFLEERQWHLEAILETHLHADFLSGASALHQAYGCWWGLGKSDEVDEPAISQLEDGHVIAVGCGQLVARHVPGHSPEHLMFCLQESADEPIWAVFTGDLLFAQSVGRPDLAAKLSSEELAHALYESLYEKLLTLDDGVVVYPGHGAGSSCGPDIGPRDLTTVGFERRHNPLLQADSEDAFVEQLLEQLEEEPSFYKRLKKQNTDGVEPLAILPAIPGLSLDTFRDLAATEDVFVLDGRETEAFRAASIPGSLNLPARDSFPMWAGRAFRPGDRLVLVAANGEELGIMRRHLFRIGLDRIEGYLANGFRTWIEAGEPTEREKVETVEHLEHILTHSPAELGHLLDVRGESAFAAGSLPGAICHPVIDLVEHRNLPDLDRQEPITVYCGSDFRATFAASWLRRAGFENVRVLLGSMKAWKAEDAPVQHSS